MNLETLIKDISELMKNANTFFNGCIYEDMCKQVADECFKLGRIEDGIFYLTEAQAAALRKECTFLREWKEVIDEDKPSSSLGLNEEYISFCSSYAKKKYKGVLERLKELPKEWTLVQISRSFEPCVRWQMKPPNSGTNTSNLHIIRLNCDDSRVPCHIFIPNSIVKNDSDLLEQIHEITVRSWMTTHPTNTSAMKKKRMENDDILKSIVNDIKNDWLKEWSCMLLGKLENNDLEKSISKSIDSIFSNSKLNVSNHDKTIIHQIANGCAYLTFDEIESAVLQTVSDVTLQENLIDEIINIKGRYKDLIIAKRMPVILILDEKLEGIPWETTSILNKHPVSRVPSLHFAHALFKKYEKSVVNGNLMLSNCNRGFYLINPENNLESTEKKMKPFFHSQLSEWTGATGSIPSKTELTKVLSSCNLFLYSGHGGGTQYLSGSEIASLRVVAMPMLFGCSSLRHKHLGGRANLVSLSHSYLLGGSPCMLGALWSVTNHDTDAISLALLNHWLLKKPTDLKALVGLSLNFPVQSFSEPELLRAIQVVRKVAMMFSNSASWVIYGLPVERI